MGRRGAREPRAEAETRARVHREGGEGRCAGRGGADLAAALADLVASDEDEGRRSGRRIAGGAKKDLRHPGSIHPNDPNDPRGGFAAPELAAATRRAVDVARTAHESAHARRVRLDAESSPGPSPGPSPGGPGRSNATAEALGTLRAAAETLERAGADVDVLSRESRAQLLDAESFRDRKSAELRAAEDAVNAESDRLAARVAELRDELARTERKAEDAAARARLASEERTEFEEAHGAVRDALKSKVSDLDRRVREYAAESAAVEAVALCVGAVAEHRKNALKTLASDAKIDEARARGAYVASVAAHARGQAGAARLCLDLDRYGLTFCADELSERREKRSAANALGLGADVDEDLAAGCAAIERKYLEAEEGMNAVLAAGAALRWEAERIAPEAFVRSGEPPGKPGTVPVRTVRAVRASRVRIRSGARFSTSSPRRRRRARRLRS